ncbi:MAG: AAA family ATPase [Bacteroidetes bacterium]|nr:AAA family ATPase [Bacteroidota bacterium]
MENVHPALVKLIEGLRLEEKEQKSRYRMDKEHTLKSLKAEGAAIHPISITRKSFGYADYPEIAFRIPYPIDNNLFRDGAAIECFTHEQESIKGILLNLEGKSGEFRLYAPDYPDWLEDGNVGIKLTPDDRTLSIMKKCLNELPNSPKQFNLFKRIHGEKVEEIESSTEAQKISLSNSQLNGSQQKAIQAILENPEIAIVHGPPGTGKTSTLLEATFQLVKQNKKVLVSTPGNAAVDHFALGLLAKGIKILRLGNTTKVHEQVYPFTPEGRLSDDKIRKEIKELKVRAEAFRKMALKYKRSFGKSEREQRNLLFQEVKNIRNEIKKIQHYNEEKCFEEAEVILGTPIGLYDANMKGIQFDTLIVDEAGQCLEPLAWCIFPLADRYVLAGDPFQLPPTVLSNEAARMGLNHSILEMACKHLPAVYLLDTQYRMKQPIAGFSSAWFYQNLLQTAQHLKSDEAHIYFYDTAGSGAQEERGSNGMSLQNRAEIDLAIKLIVSENINPKHCAFISPYSSQVLLANELLPKGIRIATIDSFQGQEQEVVLISLVRSNDDGDIGFLKDYRRMNVAMTRAKEKLYIIGDSATLGRDPFYISMLDYIEKLGTYKSIWELAE